MKNPFPYLPEDARMQRQSRKEHLLKDRRIVHFLQQNHLTEKDLEENLSLFFDWYQSMEHCGGCRGQSGCVQKIPGRIKELQVDEDGFLSEVWSPCRFAQKAEEKLAHRRNFTFSHLESEGYRINLQETDFTSGRFSDSYVAAFMTLMGSLNSQRGVMLYGQAGTGKSYLLSGTANEYAKKNKRVAFVKVPLLIQDLKTNMNDDAYRRRVLNALKYADVLFLDDLGSEAITQWSRDEILFPVLDERMNHNRLTYFSSNYTPQELESQYMMVRQPNAGVASKRFMERVRTLALPIALSGESLRPTGAQPIGSWPPGKS